MALWYGNVQYLHVRILKLPLIVPPSSDMLMYVYFYSFTLEKLSFITATCCNTLPGGGTFSGGWPFRGGAPVGQQGVPDWKSMEYMECLTNDGPCSRNFTPCQFLSEEPLAFGTGNRRLHARGRMERLATRQGKNVVLPAVVLLWVDVWAAARVGWASETTSHLRNWHPSNLSVSFGVPQMLRPIAKGRCSGNSWTNPRLKFTPKRTFTCFNGLADGWPKDTWWNHQIIFRFIPICPHSIHRWFPDIQVPLT